MPTNPVFTPVDGSGNVIGASGSPTSVTVTNTAAVNIANSPTVFTVVQPPTAQYTEAAQSRTSAGNTATQTWTSNVSQVIVGVNVTAFTGGTNVVIGLQQQDANGVWQTIGSSSPITAVGAATFSVGAGMATGAVIVSGGSYRLTWTLTGTFSALTFQLSVQGR
ncbi:hypothetical protein [Streptomyces sp. CBMA152]|uniref:hypothetical protein n=1 Tax=Streptomyces sp. CBMA152 TaxID=1896312 RepID=UPI0016604758|nr:hypothetical protein [Streptomyces sp. CBMA152]MBD0743591.1 hypothetical protein [Streptomyces sp. CBMA152]